ncbi:tyrosine recombinase XerC [Paraclostridium dentum]|uniref:tyrosine recombinase XerC n=1 Tax=Paraclostridium dentum TaxID=2662455 RepID=UPI00346418D5
MAGSIRKRGNKYQVIVELGRDVNGKRLRRYFTANSEAEARKILIEQEYLLQQNSFVIPSDMTFGEFLNYWYDNYVKIKNEETTQAEYRRILDKYIIPKLGHIKLQKLMPYHIQSYYKYLMEEVGLSPNTVYRHHANIRKALDYALKQKFVSVNVADAVELPKKIEFKSNVYTPKQLNELLNKAKDTYLEVPIALAAYLGLRRSEIVGLKWRHIDLDKRVVYIQEVRVRSYDKIVTKAPKTQKSRRALYIPEGLYKILKRWKEKQEYYKTLFGDKYVESDYVCTYFDGTPIKPDKLSRRFKEFIEKNNFPPIRLHDLRHSFATALFRNRVPIKNISEALGHANPMTTFNFYAYVIDEINKEVTTTMDNLLNNQEEE